MESSWPFSSWTLRLVRDPSLLLNAFLHFSGNLRLQNDRQREHDGVCAEHDDLLRARLQCAARGQRRPSAGVFKSFVLFSIPFLQHLQLFTEYGRMALRQTGTKPFQKLQFLVFSSSPDNPLKICVKVRDWHYPHDAPFGGEGGELVLQRLLAADEDQPLEVVHLHPIKTL